MGEFMETLTLTVPSMPSAKKSYKMESKVMASDVDWRDEGYVTAVKDQGQCRSCWAFGAVASMEAAHFEKYGSTVQMSEQQIVDCDNRNSGCNGGWYDTAWRYVSEEGGIETTADYPYHAENHHARLDKTISFLVFPDALEAPTFSVTTMDWLEM